MTNLSALLKQALCKHDWRQNKPSTVLRKFMKCEKCGKEAVFCPMLGRLK